MNDSSAPRWSRATATGLIVALLAPLASYAVGHAGFGSSLSLARVALGLALHWITLALLLAIVLRWERRSIGSIGVRPVQWWTLPAGLIAGVAIIFLSGILVHALRLQTDTTYVGLLQSLPMLARLLIAVTAGIFEETLYRGYALERLAALFGSKWLAGGCTLILFTLAHVPAVGWAHILPVGVVSLFVTLLYLWRRDLVLNMVAHATVDAVGLILAPMVGR